MDQICNSINLGALLDHHLGALKGNKLAKMLKEQRQLISQTITIEEVLYRSHCYYYQIKCELGDVYRRYSDFEMLASYVFKKYPHIIQKVLPPKENLLQFLTSHVYENQDIIGLRKQKFHIYLNDLKDKIMDDYVWKQFLTGTLEFSDIMLNVDETILEQQKYLTRLKQYGLSFIFNQQSVDNRLYTTLQAKIQQLQIIMGHMELFHLNLQLSKQQEPIVIDNKEIEKALNNKIKNIGEYFNEQSAQNIEGLLIKMEETVELFNNIKLTDEQLKSFNNLLDDEFTYIRMKIDEL